MRVISKVQLASFRPASLCGQRNRSASGTSPARSGRPIVATRFAPKRRTANPSGRRSSWRSREGQALRQTEAGQACQRRKIREQKDLPLGGAPHTGPQAILKPQRKAGVRNPAKIRKAMAARPIASPSASFGAELMIELARSSVCIFRTPVLGCCQDVLNLMHIRQELYENICEHIGTSRAHTSAAPIHPAFSRRTDSSRSIM